MQKLDWFRRKLLEHFDHKANCRHNLFSPHSNFLPHLLGKPPDEKEIILAQKALDGLISDGLVLVYDTNGGGWCKVLFL